MFYDSIFGTARFEDFHLAYQAAGLQDSWFGRIQTTLLNAYLSDAQYIGSGNSPFPSLHVAMTVVTTLYLGEKAGVLGAFGVMATAAILFVSIWNGFHYGIDGYASILLIVAAHVILKRRQSAKRDPYPDWPHLYEARS